MSHSISQSVNKQHIKHCAPTMPGNVLGVVPALTICHLLKTFAFISVNSCNHPYVVGTITLISDLQMRNLLKVAHLLSRIQTQAFNPTAVDLSCSASQVWWPYQANPSNSYTLSSFTFHSLALFSPQNHAE